MAAASNHHRLQTGAPMSIKNDRWIKQMAEQHGMIDPFEPNLRRFRGAHISIRLMRALQALQQNLDAAAAFLLPEQPRG